MTKSELMAKMAEKQPHLLIKDVELAVNSVVESMTAALANGERIEIRGFGGFSINRRQARVGRNPKTGDAVHVPSRYMLHFKPGLELREKVNGSRTIFNIIRDV